MKTNELLINSNNECLFILYSAYISFVMVKTIVSTKNLEVYHTILQVATDITAIDGVPKLLTLLF